MITSDIMVLRPAAQNVPPGVSLPAGPRGLPGPTGLPGPPGETQDISGKLDATVAALLLLLDGLPILPASPSAYPAAGGLFRDADANGYRLVRILPAS